MGFLDRLLGAPTMDKLVRDVTRELESRGAQDLKVDPDQGELAFRLHGGDMKLYLGNLLHDLQRCPRARRPALLQRFVDGVLTPDDAIPATYAEARARLLPVVRRRGDIAIAAQFAQGDSDDPSRRLIPASRPLVGDLVVALVCDRPTSMAYVNEAGLPTWQVTFDQALDDALDNLRGLPEHGGWRQLGQGVWSGEWGDAYDSSRMLLPDLIHRVGVRDPVVAVPFRNALLLTSAGNEAGIALMAQVVREHAEDNQRWLSFQPLRLDGTTWLPFAPLVAVDDWHELNLRNEAGLAESQKELLDATHARQGIDLFVASYQILSREDLGTLSFCLWSEGVDMLLPRTEFVMFHPAGQPASADNVLLVAWDAAHAVVGDLMEATAHVPERRRVRRFPDEAQWARLRAVAIGL